MPRGTTQLAVSLPGCPEGDVQTIGEKKLIYI